MAPFYLSQIGGGGMVSTQIWGSLPRKVGRKPQDKRRSHLSNVTSAAQMLGFVSWSVSVSWERCDM